MFPKRPYADIRLCTSKRSKHKRMKPDSFASPRTDKETKKRKSTKPCCDADACCDVQRSWKCHAGIISQVSYLENRISWIIYIIYTHTYIHACIHTFIHTYIHTYIHTHAPTYIHTHTYIHIYTYKHTYYLPTYLPTYIHTYIHTYARIVGALWGNRRSRPVRCEQSIR